MPRWLEDKMIDRRRGFRGHALRRGISTSPLPRVRITRQPPTQVPPAIASAQATFTQSGIACTLVQFPYAIRANVITPIVFCASLVPCANDTSDADPTWPHRNVASRRRCGTQLTNLNTTQVPIPATSPAMIGANTAGSTIELITPPHLTPPARSRQSWRRSSRRTGHGRTTTATRTAR